MDKGNAPLTLLLVLCLIFGGQSVGKAEPAGCCELENSGDSSKGVAGDEEIQAEDLFKPQEDYGGDEPGFKRYLKDTAIHYGFMWAGRLFYVRNKNERIFDTSFSEWIDNITKAPVWDDEDSFVTNLVYHPLFGAEYYLFYRARGHSVWASAIGSFIQSTLFEYTIEGLVETPSGKDLVYTPGVGVPMGIAMENISEWLIKRENTAAKVAAYIVNPTRIFIQDRKFGIMNPLTGTFAFQTPIVMTPATSKALALGYPFSIEPPVPLGRFVGDFEWIWLDEEFGNGDFIFYSIRVDLPSSNNLYGIYIKVPYAGVNNVTFDGDDISDGFEFSNVMIGGKLVAFDSRRYSVAGGLELILPTAFKDNIDRLKTVVNYHDNFPLYLTKATTISPYISASVQKRNLSLIGNLGIDFILNADNFEGDEFEARIKYGTAMGLETSLPVSPHFFVEFNGYTILSASSIEKTDLFLTPGVRLGKKWSPGFGIQIPVTGASADIAKAGFIVDFQARF
ncbi:MAG TPA: DUF3943 domain-containing protein [Thermodesulfobacteriota bacterium]|nr:DUF3943 domain-containing protein [Thermodesulfobacteriota bacterium]